MKRASARISIVLSIVRKDLRDFSRDTVWMVLTPASLVFMIVIFMILPVEVEEVISLGIAPEPAAEFLSPVSRYGGDGLQGVNIVAFPDSSSLADAVYGNGEGNGSRVIAGLLFPDEFPAGILAGDSCSISLIASGSLPSGIGPALASGLRELAYAMRALSTGRDPLSTLPVALPDIDSMVLGEDMAGQQVPLRDQMRPMLVVIILLIESLALAGLVSVEIEHRTAGAILVTPARTGDLLAAKCVTGLLLASVQALLFLLVTGSMAMNWPLVLLAVLLGSVMATSVGMMSGAAGKDFMGTLFFGMLFLIPLMIPAFSLLFPGYPPLAVRILPSYDLMASLSGILGRGLGWRFALPHLVRTAVWDILLLGAALLILRRRLESA